MKVSARKFVASVALLLVVAACGSDPVDDLADGVCELPKELREVSAITQAADGTLACLQDELGALFWFDIEGRRPTTTAVFGERGDYEALVRVDADYWLLRSDGFLARVAHAAGNWRIVGSSWLPGGPREWEALCFDASRRRLLAMPKEGVGSSKSERDQRALFAIDLATGVATEAPVCVLQRRSLLRQAEALGLDVPVRTTDKGKERAELELTISEIAVVPGKAELLLLSAKDHAVLRVDYTGRLLGLRRLDAAVLPQPEGLTVLADGRLVVASEGAGGAARLMVVPMP